MKSVSSDSDVDVIVEDSATVHISHQNNSMFGSEEGGARYEEVGEHLNISEEELNAAVRDTNNIRVLGAKEHNLKNISLTLPRNKLIVITGPSGSGKSSLAFDTIYAEGQRRYVESLSSYARQFLQMNDKPNVEFISGLSPSIAIDQKTTSRNPRSTVGTSTEIYDYMRLLFARIGVPHSPATGLPISHQSVGEMVDIVVKLPIGTKIYILAPIIRGSKGEFRKEIVQLKKQGFEKIIIDGEVYSVENYPNIDRNKKHNIEVVVSRIVLYEGCSSKIMKDLESALKLTDGIVYANIASIPDVENIAAFVKERIGVDVNGNNDIVFSSKYSCPVSGFQLPELEPRIFSFNSPFGACQQCSGTGMEKFINVNLVIPDKSLSMDQGAIAPFSHVMNDKVLSQTLKTVVDYLGYSMSTPLEQFSEEDIKTLFYGSDKIRIDNRLSRTSTITGIATFCGIIGIISSSRSSQWFPDNLIESISSSGKCSSCGGYRIAAQSLCVKVDNMHIGQVTEMTIRNTIDWVDRLPSVLTPKQALIAHRILKEIRNRLGFLMNVGLGYLTLSRESGTLSGGESQRIRLASQIGTGLMGIIYVLDEPSIGLHQRDNEMLINTLKILRDLGNTVIVVEHDEDTMLAADYIVDMGPGAGMRGGHIVCQGTVEDVLKSDSLTGLYLSRRKKITVPRVTRPGNGKFVELRGARINNLQNVNVKIPLGTFTSVTGVSGSGKSSLVLKTLYTAIQNMINGPTNTSSYTKWGDDEERIIPNNREQKGEILYDNIFGVEWIDKIIDIDQSPIGRTPRSNPATYTGAFTPIRDWYTNLPDSKLRGYKAGRFSFNVKGGRCEACEGDGVVRIEMHFLPDVYVKCDVCDGKRYNRETLEVKHNDKNISDVLEMTVEDAVGFCADMPFVKDKIQCLQNVGLGYIKLGQSATTLSGGEAQRVKLAKELARKSTGRTLYILDEPTTGLHVSDIAKLLDVLHKLVDLGNTVLVIEHNLDVIKTSDYIIDVGPDGGDKGGKIVVAGTPNEVINCKESHTGKYLKAVMEKDK